MIIRRIKLLNSRDGNAPDGAPSGLIREHGYRPTQRSLIWSQIGAGLPSYHRQTGSLWVGAMGLGATARRHSMGCA